MEYIGTIFFVNLETSNSLSSEQWFEPEVVPWLNILMKAWMELDGDDHFLS